MKTIAIFLLALLAQPSQISGWKTLKTTDEMTDKVHTTAWLTSSNSIDMSEASEEPSHVGLGVSEEFKLIMVTLSHGTIIGGEGHDLEIVVDGGELKSFHTKSASNQIIVEDYSKFLSEVRTAKSIRLRFDVLGIGSVVAKFSATEPLDFNK